MRCFIAIDIEKAQKGGLDALQSDIKGLAIEAGVRKGDVKWVRSENIHLTLKFLGEVKDAKVVEICNIVKEAAGRHKSFDLEVGGVGFFGGSSAKVLWVGSGEGFERLGELQKDIEGQLALAGWPEERREFSGHLTLCRIRNYKAGVKLARISEDYKDFKLGVTLVDSVSVYHSELTPKGPIYSVMGNYKLGESS